MLTPVIISTFVNSVSRNQLLAVLNYKHLQMYQINNFYLMFHN